MVNELDCSKLEKGNYEWLICQYQKGARGALHYYKSEKNGLNDNYLSVDFSELFLYMYNDGSRFDFKLTNYIFNDKLKRDFKFAILPPAIFELYRHYNFLRKKNIACKRSKISFSTTDRLSRLFDEVGELDKIRNKKLLAKQMLKLNKEYRNEISGILKIDSPISMATEYGYKNVLDKSYNRMMDLFKNQVILKPDQLNISLSLDEIDSDDYVLNKLLSILEKERRVIGWNNFIDAEHAALNFAINKHIIKENYLMFLYTGSPTPLRVYENECTLDYFKDNGKRLFFPKCPIYVTMRLFCENELLENSIYNIKFLENSVKVLDTLNPSVFEETLKNVYNQKNEGFKDYRKRALGLAQFFDIYLKNEKFSCYLEEALKLSEAHELIQATQELIARDEIDKIMRIKEIAEDEDVFKSNDLFLDRLAKSQDLLYNNSSKIYKELCSRLADHDITMLSPLMLRYYNELKEAPKKPDEFEEEMKTEDD